MNNPPFFSIIIPVFNHAGDFLQEAIESVFCSSFKDFEVIIIDDGSTDDSLIVINQIAQKHSNISVFSQFNQGQTVARMKGVYQAKGQYIVFLDSDDMLNPSSLIILYNEITNNYELDMICFEFIWMNTKGIIESPSEQFLYQQGITFCGNTKNQLLLILATSYRLNNICCKVIRRSLLTQIDFSFLPHVVYGEDKIQSLTCILSAERIRYIPKYLYYYRRNPKSMMQRKIGVQRIQDFDTFSLYVLKQCIQMIDVFVPWLNYTSEEYCNMAVDILKEKGGIKLLRILKNTSIFKSYIMPNMKTITIPRKKKLFLFLFYRVSRRNCMIEQ